MISPADAKKINQSYEYNVKMWRSRKRKVRGRGAATVTAARTPRPDRSPRIVAEGVAP